MDNSQPEKGSSAVVTPGTSVEEAISTYVSIRSKGGGGRHAHESRRVLEKLNREHWRDLGIETVDDLSVLQFRKFAERLYRRAYAKERNPETGITGSTAHHYYGLVQAWTAWLDEHGAAENLADDPTAKEQLPDESVGKHEDAEKQFWSESTREEIVRWADWRFESAADESWMDPVVASRDRALVALLAYSAVRGAEAVRDPRNDRRPGLRWSDFDFEDETVRVFGKSQKYETVPLHDRALSRLRAHKRRLDPPRDTWPVFQTTHLATLYKLFEDDDVDPTADTIDELVREHDKTPPSISVNSARNVLERLCLESGIREAGEILKPHGARRGLGDQIYHEESPQDAQSLLRHESIETTHRHYEQDDTERTRTALDGVLGDGGSRE